MVPDLERSSLGAKSGRLSSVGLQARHTRACARNPLGFRAHCARADRAFGRIVLNDRDVTKTPSTYQIGTVSSLTGVDAHTIRAWERRYGALEPTRDEAGRRRYDDHAIERLQLLKGLVDCSEPIGAIARLSDDELRDRLSKLAAHEEQSAAHRGPAAVSEGPTRLALLAPSLAMQIDSNAAAFGNFDVVLVEEAPEKLLDRLSSESCDVVILEHECLNGRARSIVEKCLESRAQPQVVVLYRFATRVELARLARLGATLVRSPIRLDSLRQVILDRVMIDRARGRSLPATRSKRLQDLAESGAIAREQWPERRFDDAQLARLFEVTSSIDCECPNHISSLVAGLVSFENYSRNCESRDDADAAQHRRLARGTSEARATMEKLLAELCEHEGIHV